MEEEVMKKHIDLYVNNFSLGLGTDGQNAIEQLMRIYQNTRETSIIHVKPSDDLFLK